LPVSRSRTWGFSVKVDAIYPAPSVLAITPS
jgi:hypothetical protein